MNKLAPLRRHPAPVLLSALLAGTALLSACGGGGEAPPPPTAVALADDAVDGAIASTAAEAEEEAAAAEASIGVKRLSVDPVVTGVAGGQLTVLRYNGPRDWLVRTLQSSAADSTPDGAGLTRYSSVFMQSESNAYNAGASVRTWAHGNSFARSADLHWNGSDWVACPLGGRFTTTLRDATSRADYSVCDGMEKGRSSRTVLDLTGQRIATVFATKIRTMPGGSNGVAYADWGPSDPAAAFGTATFPAGSKLIYQTNLVTESAIAYDPLPTNVVTGFSAAVAAGGDTRVTAGLACAGTVTAAAMTTLEDVIGRNPGTPCIFSRAVSGSDMSLNPNESWGTTTASLAVIAGAANRPAGTGNWYSNQLYVRVAFAGGGSTATTYYRCLTRAVSPSPRNCTMVGSGSYSIRTQGDARVMTFTGPASVLQQAGSSRVFVERGGKVYYGYQLPTGGSNRLLRLNLEAANAVMAALPGLPAIVPTTRHADLSAASQAALDTARGVWITDEAEPALLRIGDNGRYLFGQATPFDAATLAQTGHEVGWIDYDAATHTFRALVESSSAGEGGMLRRSAAEQGSETLTISPTELISSLGARFTRLTNDPTGLVGLWAFSPTEFEAQHVVFLPSGKVMMIDPQGDTEAGACSTARKGPPGGEVASYTWDAVTGALRVFAKVYDTNGCAGFFDATDAIPATEFNATVVLASGGMTATVTAPDGTYTIYRIAP